MCFAAGVPLLGLAIGAASSAASVAADMQAADDQEAIYKQNRSNALQSFEDAQRTTNQRISQERESAALAKFDTALESRAARATNAVASGESGVSGITIDALARDFASREQRYNDRVDRQLGWTVQDLEAQKTGQAAQALDRFKSQPHARKPSFIGAGLRIAAAGLSGYSQHRKVNV